MGKQYITRDGKEIRIYATDCGRTGLGIHGAVKTPKGWYVTWWDPDGTNMDYGEHKDLIELPEKKPRLLGYVRRINGMTLCLPDPPSGSGWERAEWLDEPKSVEEWQGDRENAKRI